MDKIMKVEIEKVMCNVYECALFRLNNIDKKKDVDLATSSLNALIIKWLEEKRNEVIPLTSSFSDYISVHREEGRNQLITELVEELR